MEFNLLHQFGQNYPEEFDGILDCISIAVTCAFNRRGTLLAVGCNDGRVVIWDFLTRGIAKIIPAHIHPVVSLNWSRNCHNLVTASTDNTVRVWEGNFKIKENRPHKVTLSNFLSFFIYSVLSGDCIIKLRFPSPIIKVQFNPRNDKIILICPMKHVGVLVYLPGHPGIYEFFVNLLRF